MELAPRLKSVDYLIERHEWLSWASILLLVLAASTMILVGLAPSNTFDSGGGIHILSAAMLGSVIVVGLVLMVSATYFAVRGRESVSDIAMFLFVVWIFPYFGVALFLGLTKLARIIRGSP